MPKVNVIDDFLPKSIFEKLSESICINGVDNRIPSPQYEFPPPFPWYWTANSLISQKDHLKEMENPHSLRPWDSRMWDSSEYKQEKNSFGQFVHLFYDRGPVSPYYENFILPLWEMLNVFCLIKCRAVMIPQTNSITIQGFHSDIPKLPLEKINLCTTAILYMNTNDGYTELADGQKIESIANRLMTFPAGLEHSGTTCTNQPHRTTLNFNYIDFK